MKDENKEAALIQFDIQTIFLQTDTRFSSYIYVTTDVRFKVLNLFYKSLCQITKKNFLLCWFLSFLSWTDVVFALESAEINSLQYFIFLTTRGVNL